MCMIKNLASNRLSTSTPSSPQLSENGDGGSFGGSSGGYPTPLTTPDTPSTMKTLFSPRGKAGQLVRKISSGDLGGNFLLMPVPSASSNIF